MDGYLEKGTGIYKDKPQRLYRAGTSPRPYRKRLRRALMVALAGGGVFVLFSLPLVTDAITNFDLFAVPDVARSGVILAGRLIALLVLLLGAVRAALNVVPALRRRLERVTFYGEGFVWERPGAKNRHGWKSVKTIRENPRRWQIGGRTVLEWGEVTFKLRDGTRYRLTPAHTDLNAFLERVRPYYADIMGTRMAQRARQGQSFRVHPKLVVTPEGLVINNKQRIGWANLHVRVDDGELVVSHIKKGGSPRPVTTYPAHEVDNLAGLLDFVEMTADNFQRDTYYG